MQAAIRGLEHRLLQQHSVFSWKGLDRPPAPEGPDLGQADYIQLGYFSSLDLSPVLHEDGLRREDGHGFMAMP